MSFDIKRKMPPRKTKKLPPVLTGKASSDDDAQTASNRINAKPPPVGSFDASTGAIGRETIVYGEDTSKSAKATGYGRTPQLHEHPFLKPQLTLISGPTGSGKTIAMLNMVDEIMQNVDSKRFGKVLLYSGSPGDKALRDVDTSSGHVEIYGPEHQSSLLDNLRKMQLESRHVADEERKLSVLVLDDAGSSKELAPTLVKGSEIGEILVSHRHLGLHVIIMCQRVKGMASPFLMANLSNIVVYPGHNKSDEQELLRNIPLSRAQLERTLNAIRSEKHQFLFVNIPRKSAMVGWGDCVLS